MRGNKKVDFSPETQNKIGYALCEILAGNSARVDINKNVKVYECKNVIRIDLKITEEE